MLSYLLVTKVELTTPISSCNGRQGLYGNAEHGASKAGMTPVKKNSPEREKMLETTFVACLNNRHTRLLAEEPE